MEELQLNQQSLESASGVHHSNISDYLSGKTMPSFETLTKLLYFFNCSADYLLGEVEIPTEEKLFPVIPFSVRFKEILANKKISQEKLRKDLNISSSVMYKWTSGSCNPTATSLIRIAKYLDCSIDYLIGRLR